MNFITPYLFIIYLLLLFILHWVSGEKVYLFIFLTWFLSNISVIDGPILMKQILAWSSTSSLSDYNNYVCYVS